MLNFTFDMVGSKTARLVITDGKEERYSIPEEVVKKPKREDDKRLEMLGFQLKENDTNSPFSF